MPVSGAGLVRRRFWGPKNPQPEQSEWRGGP